MWNYYALPKWIILYHTSGSEIFEMPLLGYTGYLPFALELFAMYQFILFLAQREAPLPGNLGSNGALQSGTREAGYPRVRRLAPPYIVGIPLAGILARTITIKGWKGRSGIYGWRTF